MKAEVVINKTAGGGKANKLFPEIIRIFDKMKLDYHINWTTSLGGATELARIASHNGADLIVSVGGDGTINEVINGILSSQHQLPLAIIPAGWANDFIKSTSIPRDINEACQVIKNGKVRNIDVGIINSEIYFANVCGIGFDAEIADLANRMKTKYSYSKTFSSYVYVFAAIRKLLPPLPSFKMKITIDGQIIEKEIVFLAIANGQVEGGKFNIAPYAVIDDGMLDICLVGRMGRLRCLHLLPKAVKGTHCDVEEVDFFRGKEISIEFDKPVTGQVAGEMLIPQKKYYFKILPKKLKLMVP